MITSLLKGKMVLSFLIHEREFCSLRFNNQYTLSIETLCRFVGVNGEFISSADHGHRFGLPEPFDASSAIAGKIQGETILDVELKDITNDLVLTFNTGRFEIICSSSGYESFQINGPDNFIMVGRGGRK
jgi:hypothetical protein